ncbi:MAG: hypothetical protein BAJALOKI1v1_2150004 [Promethearchaeota archaeon]|nr:MAG: hypothetical protein BAJALOKI1v1_2150004 [Candidatus Lokiarchaeota archaeon]
MRWILDACTLIYLVKTDLIEHFIMLLKYPLVIDSSVFKEVVIDGKVNTHPDAFKAENILEKFKIPVINIDISKDVYLFRDAGETSCYILAKEEGICMTSDERAYKKFITLGMNVIRLDTFYFQKCIDGVLNKKEFLEILRRLEENNATKPKSILFFIEQLQKREINND